MVESFLPGLSALQSIHPMFVHFPIAFFLGVLAMEGIAILWHERFHYVATWMLYLGTFAAIMTLRLGSWRPTASRRLIRAAMRPPGTSLSTFIGTGWWP